MPKKKKKSSHTRHLHEETSLIKIIIAVLFVIIPLLAFLYGMQLQAMLMSSPGY